MEPTLVEKLRAIPLFAELTDESLERLSTVVTEFEAEGGHVLIQPGQEGSGMFVLEEGEVVVEVPGRTYSCEPGEFFGELALLGTGIVRTARVRATSHVRCLAISRADFAGLLEAEPRMAVAMLPVLAQRLADADRDA